MRPWPGRAAGAVLVTTLAAAGVAFGATPASAHDVLLHTDPSDGATVARVPDQVVLTFDRPVLALGTAVEVVGPTGDVASGTPVLVDTTVAQPVSAGSPAGAYVVRWRVTSADGHPVSGSFRFTARAPGGSATPSPLASTGESAAGSPGTSTGSAASVLWWGGSAVLAVAVAALVATAVRRWLAGTEVREDPGGDDG